MEKARAYNRWTLRFFDRKLELAFREDDFFKGLKRHRTACLEGAFLYALFGILDWVILPEQRAICWAIRFCLVCPLLLGVYFFSYTRWYRKYQTLLALLVGTATSMGLIAMIAIAPSPGNHLYYAGLLLCSMFFYGQIPDHLISNCLSWGSFFIYLAVGALLTDTPGKVLFSNVFIFYFFNISGMIICYTMEQSRRLDYLRQLTIARQARDLEQALRDMEKERRHAEELSLLDPLTGLSNRRHFFTMADKEYKRKLRYHHSLSVILLDIDHFKRINDTYGHAVGDKVLREVAGIIAGAVRKCDLACRYGGEEFAVLLPEADPHAARQIGERLRRRIAAAAFVLESGRVSVSASIGLASLEEEQGVPLAVLLERADQMLYEAKHSGRNRLRQWGAPGTEKGMDGAQPGGYSG